ncbi:hypothetical protein AB0425_17880 [Actinosynnema sp. NPDC051121]
MTSTLPTDTTDTAERLKIAEQRRADAETKAAQLSAGLEAVIDVIVERHRVRRLNCGHYPPTERELAELATADRAYWLGIAHHAGGVQ